MADVAVTSDVGAIANAVAAGANIVSSVVKYVTQEDAEDNTKAMEIAALEKQALAAHDRLMTAIQNRDLATLEQMAQHSPV